MTNFDGIGTRRYGRIGHILLNRPKVLNALDLSMIEDLTTTLNAWADDPSIQAVVVEGAGGRAFCAGGDIRMIRERAIAGDTGSIETFFRGEYALNRLIARYPKPYVALVDGVCMGGGIGVSVHGAIRVATENAIFAMPETAIGFFPDVGATYILPRLPGWLGMYLGLTGSRLTGADAVYAGLATHFVQRVRLRDLSDALANDGVAAVAAFCVELSTCPLAAHRPAIDRCFSASSIAEIERRLEDEGAWGQETLATMSAASPSALEWSFEIIAAGAGRTLEQCLEAELQLTMQATSHADFAEGVRAMLVDKDRQPAWVKRELPF